MVLGKSNSDSGRLFRKVCHGIGAKTNAVPRFRFAKPIYSNLLKPIPA
jgi:hypothetical protein